MTEKSWMEIDSTNTMAAASIDGTIHMFPSKIHASAVAILDPILIPELLEEIDRCIIITADIEEDIHHLICEFIEIETTEDQDHHAMRWCYEDE